MKKRMFACVAVVALASTAAAVAAPKYQLTLAGGAPRGVWSLIGTGVNNALAAAYPGSSVTYQASGGGGLANIPMVSANKVPLALAEDSGVQLAVAGKKPFRKKYANLRGIAFIAGWLPMHWIVEKGFADKHGLRKFSDIAKAKPPIRLTVNRRSNMAAHVSIKMLELIGVTPGDIKKWGGQIVYQPSPEQVNLMLDRRIDMVSNQLPLKHRTIRQMQKSMKLILLDVNPDLSRKAAKAMGQQLFTIPKGTYSWQQSALLAPSLGTTLIASTAMSEKTAYDVTKALVEQIGKIQTAHPFLGRLSKEYLASLKVVTYHTGAARYYKEAGLR